uniref:Uncharacterized protein n=1 Tax=Mustela putorius furo TaxID=9669 RepID=M3XU06_MUSPF
MEPELKSRFTNPPTLSAYISLKPQRPGHPQTYAKSLRGSGGRAAAASHSPWRGRRAVRGIEGQPGRRRTPHTRARAHPPGPSSPRFHPRTCKANLRVCRRPARALRRGEKKPAPPPNRCAPSPRLTDRHWERRGPPWQTGSQAARPPPPPGQRSPGRGGVPGPRPPRPPRSRILGASCLPHLPARPSCAHSRPAPLESGDEKGNPDRPGPHRNALEDAPGRGCPDVFGVAVADNGGLLAAAIAHQVIHVALPTGHLRALRTAAGTARSSRRSGGGGSGRRAERAGAVSHLGGLILGLRGPAEAQAASSLSTTDVSCSTSPGPRRVRGAAPATRCGGPLLRQRWARPPRCPRANCWSGKPGAATTLSWSSCIENCFMTSSSK